MTAPSSASLLTAIEMAPRDPILGITEAFNADKNPNKINLGVGVYYDDNGKVPLLECVQTAEKQLTERLRHAPICRSTAWPPTTKRCRSWCSAPTALSFKRSRAVTVQALGGTGALKVGADFLKRFCARCAGLDQRPELGKPPRAVRSAPASRSNNYPYYDAATRGLDFAGDAGVAARHAAPAPSSCCTPAATTRPASI